MPPPFVTAASAWVDARIASATRLPMAASRAHGGGAAVECHGGGAERGVDLLAQLALVLGHDGRHLGVGRHRRGIDDAKLRHQVTPRRPFSSLTVMATSMAVT